MVVFRGSYNKMDKKIFKQKIVMKSKSGDNAYLKIPKILLEKINIDIDKQPWPSEDRSVEIDYNNELNALIIKKIE